MQKPTPTADGTVPVAFVLGPWDGLTERRKVLIDGLPPGVIRTRESSPSGIVVYTRCEYGPGDDCWFYLALDEIPS